jgi:hypothetical protein
MASHVVLCGWDDVPHISHAEKADLLAGIHPHMRDARTKGVPNIGAGAIYPVPESTFVVDDFEIPKHWPRCFGMDAGGGANATAAVWLAHDRDSATLYAYSAYKSAAAEPAIHAAAIKSRGAGIPGVGDCAALIMTDRDAEQLISIYRRAGLDLRLPDKSVEAGIAEVWELLSTQRLKVFRRACQSLIDEMRLYRRDEKGRVVKQNDHLCDSLRYACRSGRARMKVQPSVEPPKPLLIYLDQGSNRRDNWMGI